MNKIDVSIVMPVKNAGEWVSETVQSILNQSFNNWELIAINDHSSDESPSILQEFMVFDQRIQSIENQENGIIPALQLGLSLAKGEFITRMDADDIMPIDRLETMVSALRNSPAKTIVTGKVEYFPSPVSDGYLKYQNWLNERTSNNDHLDHIFRECVIASPNWMARTEEIRKEGNWNKLKYPEDYDMVFKWYINGFSIQGIDQTTLLWREHPKRTSRNSSIYDQDSFFALKLSWFDLMSPNKNGKVALFGAGQKGKIVANYFLNQSIPFEWYDHNFERYNTPILGKKIADPITSTEPFAVFCIDPELQDQLHDFLREKEYSIGKNAWFF